MLEYFVGKRTPSYKDKGLTSNALEVGWPGQQDCIDETTNTTTYLILLHKHGLLTWHEVGRPLYRNFWYKFFMDPHFSAHLVETDSGQSYAVDSWFLDNGQPPYVATREDWLSKQGGWE